MRTRVIIEYDIPAGDRVAVRDREEQRWISSRTVLALAGSTTVKVELVEAPLMRLQLIDQSRLAAPPQ